MAVSSLWKEVVLWRPSGGVVQAVDFPFETGMQRELGAAGVGVRLKYFMDLLVAGSDEPSDIGLFHSKLVYLFLKRKQKSIVYLVPTTGHSGSSDRQVHEASKRPCDSKYQFCLEEYHPTKWIRIGLDRVVSTAAVRREPPG